MLAKVACVTLRHSSSPVSQGEENRGVNVVGDDGVAVGKNNIVEVKTMACNSSLSRFHLLWLSRLWQGRLRRVLTMLMRSKYFMG